MFVLVLTLETLFIILGKFKDFNSWIYGLEAVVLCAYCIFFFLKTLRVEEYVNNVSRSLLIVTGLLIYESCCFFIFLFYANLVMTNPGFAVSLWNVHNIVYIVMCLYISRAFFEMHKYEPIRS